MSPNPNPLVDSTTIDRSVEAFLAEDAVIGLSVATIRRSGDESLVWSKGYGLRDRESGDPVDADTTFWVGSVSKAVMGATIMIARERGFLQLDDDVHAVIENAGDFSLDNPGRQAISIADLGSHTSGIVDGDAYLCAYHVPRDDGGHDKLTDLFDVGISCPDGSAVTLPGFLAAYLDAGGAFHDVDDNFLKDAPGTRVEYSNIGAGLAGYVVGLTTGQDLATFARQELFAPLGMSRTDWRAGAFDESDIATPYVEIDGELAPLPVYELATWPDGGLRTNARDLARFLSVVLDAGIDAASGQRLLTEDSLARMLPGADGEPGLFWERGGPTRIDGERRPLTGHSGSDPGAFSFMFFDPVSETGVVVIGNGDDDLIDEASTDALIEALFESAGYLR